MKRFSIRHLCRLALLSAIALSIFILELQIPMPIPVPGIKLGLSNLVTLYILFTGSALDALLVLLVRVVLGALCTGQVMALLYSLSGGLVCFLVTFALRKLLHRRQIWFCSAVGAIFHNLTQLGVAILITNTPELWIYLPVLLLCGIAAGLFTGFAAQALIQHMRAF